MALTGIQADIDGATTRDGLTGNDANGLVIGELLLRSITSDVGLESINQHRDEVLDFRKNNLALLIQMAAQRPLLQKSLNDKGANVRVSVTFFINWSWTQFRFLFLVCPKTREEVVAVVQSCAQLDIKVSLYSTFLSNCNHYYLLFVCRWERQDFVVAGLQCFQTAHPHNINAVHFATIIVIITTVMD